MKAYQISASIVVYKNDPALVVSAIKSILAAPMRIACTIVDNSPTPDLKQHVLECGANYIFSGENLGFGRGHNVALFAHHNSSEYQLILNPDVCFAPEVPSALYCFMNNNLDVGLVMPKVLYPNGTNQHLCKQFPSPLDLLSRRFLGKFGRFLFKSQLSRYELQHLHMGTAREVPCLSGCFMFMRSAVLDEVGFFDDRYFMYMEDVDLCRRIGMKYKTVYYPDVVVTHGYVKGSYRNIKLLTYHLQSAFKYFMKWGWIFDAQRSFLNNKTASLKHLQDKINQ